MNRNIASDILMMILRIGIISSLIFLLMTTLFGVIRVNDYSMAPSMKEGDLCIYTTTDKHINVSELVIVKYKNTKQVRRVVATAGDIVNIKKDGLYINNGLLIEDYIYEDTMCFDDGITYPYKIEEGEVFVLGDKRTSSIDSRLYGAVKINDIKGKMVYVIRNRDV